MEYLTVNSVGKYKEVTSQGRKYLVVPLRLIVPGVMNGSKGPLLYTEEENRKNYSDWNTIPLVAPTHPTINKRPISAKIPSIRLKYGIGHVANSLISKTGCLDSEGWFDYLFCNRVDNRIIQWIKTGTPIELSTGLGADEELVENGNYKGTPYRAKAKNYRPDHVAILCDEIGACSVAMGCGVGIRNNYDKQIAKFVTGGVLLNNLTSNKDSSMDKKTLWEKLGELVGITNSSQITNEASYMDLVEALSRQLKEKYTALWKEYYPNKGMYEMPYLRIEDVFSDSVIFCYDNSIWKIGYSTASNDTITLSEEEPIEVQRVTSYQEITENSISSGKKISDLIVDDLWEPVVNPYPNEHAARLKSPDSFLKNTFRRKELAKGISAIMGKMSTGGPMKIQALRFNAKQFTAEEARAWLAEHHYMPVSFEKATNNSENTEQVTDTDIINTDSSLNKEGDFLMPLTPEVRKSMLDGLIANCNCNHNVPWKGKDAATLNALSDDTIQAYDTWRKTFDTTPVAPPINNNPTQVVNHEKGSFFIDATGNQYLMNPVTNQLVKVNGIHVQTSIGQGTSQGNQATQQNPQGNSQVTNTPNNTSVNVQEWLNNQFKNAPPEAAEIYNTMQEAFIREKIAHIERLTTNLQGEAKDQAVSIYNAMNLQQLKVLTAGLPQQQPQNTPIVNWIGNAPVQPGGGAINEKPLPVPKVDYKDIRNKRKQSA